MTKNEPTPLLLATRNRGKVEEFRRLFAGLPLQLVPLDAIQNAPEVVEDGTSFEQNAEKKARQIAEVSPMLVLADDSGLEVDALGGAPGVRSARLAGEQASDADNNAHLLELLRHASNGGRRARFRCVLALADPRGPLRGRVYLVQGVCEGSILHEPRGRRGFGYDPLFVPTGETRSMAELSPAEKNRLSHRARAASQMRDFLSSYLARSDA